MITTFSFGIATSSLCKLTLIQISRSQFSPPTDVTLKLADGSIDVHRMILAAVSPVFERMFYGDFKEGKSMAVDLPKDSSKIMKLLVDFVYQGNCELGNLDDILPVLEVFDRYQINKNPFYHMCSEIIVTRLDYSNYLTLLPKFASVMSEEGTRKAASKVMLYTNNDFINKFDDTKELPEEILIQLLQMDITNHEVDIFDFLVKWHDYQSKDLGRSLRLTQQIFRCIRYSLIIPQILSFRVVARCDLVSKQLLGDAYHYIYNSCKPLGEYDSKECSQEPISLSRKPKKSLKIEWVPYQDQVTMKHDQLDECDINFNGPVPVNNYVIKSLQLKNGIYTFSVHNIAAASKSYRNNFGYVSNPYPDAPISVAISGQGDKYLYCYPLISDSLITVYVHDEYLFLKLIEGDKVKSTTSLFKADLFRICICSLLPQGNSYYCSFRIHNHAQ